MGTPTTIDRLRERPRASRRTGTERVLQSIRGIEAWHAARQRDGDGIPVLSDAEQRQHDVIVLATSQQLQEAGSTLNDKLDRRTVVVVAAPDDVADPLLSALARAGLVVVALCCDTASAVGFAVVEQPDFVLVAGDVARDFTSGPAHEVARFSPTTNIVVLDAGYDLEEPPRRRVHVVSGALPASLVARWMADAVAM